MAGEICPKMKFNTTPSLLSLIDFEQLCINILGVTREQDGITIAYLRNMSALFSVVATIREKDINLPLQAERYYVITRVCL